MEVWINPACSKCSSALSLLDAEGAHCTVRRYLEQPPTTQELEQILDRLRLEPWDITRLAEPAAANLGMESHRCDSGRSSSTSGFGSAGWTSSTASTETITSLIRCSSLIRSYTGDRTVLVPVVVLLPRQARNAVTKRLSTSRVRGP
jgi:hypothetical protein